MRGFVESGRFLALTLVLTVAGCAPGSPTVAPFSLREAIPLGILDLSVTRWDELQSTRSPLGSLHPPEGEKPVVVFLRWDGLDEFAELDRRVFVEAFLEDRLTLVDSDGFEYETVNAMPEPLYRMSSAMNPMSAPRDWVAVFWAWVDSDGYSLRVEHPEPDPDGFDFAVVEL